MVQLIMHYSHELEKHTPTAASRLVLPRDGQVLQFSHFLFSAQFSCSILSMRHDPLDEFSILFMRHDLLNKLTEIDASTKHHPSTFRASQPSQPLLCMRHEPLNEFLEIDASAKHHSPAFIAMCHHQQQEPSWTFSCAATVVLLQS